MFTNKLWISNDYKKIKNPVRILGTINKIQGLLAPNHDFKHQTENFERIKQSLAPFGIVPTEIYSAERVGKATFVVCFSNPNIFWQKYEGESYGSGQNYIFWKSQKIKTTVWIDLNQDQIAGIINGP